MDSPSFQRFSSASANYSEEFASERPTLNSRIPEVTKSRQVLSPLLAPVDYLPSMFPTTSFVGNKS
jgi:hypothetical protein